MCYFHCVKLLTVLLFGLVNADQTKDVMVCENGDRQNIVCPSEDVIIIQEVTAAHKGNCGSWNRDCANFMNNNIRKECNRKTSCNVSYETLYNPCDNLPRHMDVHYHCKEPWWMLGIFGYSERKSVCIKSLSEVSCIHLFDIEIKDVQIQADFEICNDHDDKCILKELRHLCDDKRKCSSIRRRKQSCLFYNKFALVSYGCSDNSTTLPTITSIVEVSKSTTTSRSTSFGNDNGGQTQSTYPFPEYVPSIEITTDDSDRVLWSFNSSGKRFVLCADGWNNHSASLVCRYLSISQNGSAKTVENSPDYERLPVVPNCNGSESSIMECIFINATCNYSMVAGVECCEEQKYSTEWSSSEIKDKISGSSSVAIGVGVSLGSLTVLVIVVALLVFLCMRRRNFKSKEKQERSHNGNRIDDYAGQQGIALPNFSNGSPDNHTVQYTSCPGFDIETNQNNEQSSKLQLNTPASNPSKNDQSTYAASQDGIYDKAHDRRHIENEANTYGHSVDDMYDTSNHQQEHDADGSSYGRVVDTVYDTSVNNSSSKVNVDNTYARTVDTTYDIASRVERKGRQDDLYD